MFENSQKTPPVGIQKESSPQAFKPLSWQDRPPEVTLQIKNKFQELADINPKWGCDGSGGDYYLCHISSFNLIKSIIQENPTRKDFYVLDVGAGKFGYGKELSKLLNQAENIPKDIKIHIIGVTGERNPEPEIREVGICTLYEYGHFAIENLIDEFKLRKCELDQKLDIIVTSWALRHLIDPLGTFLQMYSLLRPITGILMMDGFFYLRDEDPAHETYITNYNMYWLLLQTKVPFLVRDMDYTGGSLDQFVLRRPNNQLCQLPLTYAGLLQDGPGGLQRDHGFFTMFHQTSPAQIFEPITYSHQLTGDETLFNYFASTHSIGPRASRRLKSVYSLYKGAFNEEELSQIPINDKSPLRNLSIFGSSTQASTAADDTSKPLKSDSIGQLLHTEEVVPKNL